MPSYSNNSQGRLLTCSLPMQALFSTVVINYDNTIIQGHRNEPTQNEYFENGKSQVQWPNSKHNTKPSSAVDSAPYIPGRGIPWPETPACFKELNSFHNKQISNYVKDMMQFAHYAGFVQGTAQEMNIPIRWGGDWDMDDDLRDNKFDDLVHFELI